MKTQTTKSVTANQADEKMNSAFTNTAEKNNRNETLPKDGSAQPEGKRNPERDTEYSWLEVLLACEDRGLTDLRLARAMNLQFHMRIARLFGEIDEAFCGQPFLQTAPDVPANHRRFNTYIAYFQRAGDLLKHALELGELIADVSARRAASTLKEENKG